MLLATKLSLGCFATSSERPLLPNGAGLAGGKLVKAEGLFRFRLCSSPALLQ